MIQFPICSPEPHISVTEAWIKDHWNGVLRALLIRDRRGNNPEYYPAEGRGRKLYNKMSKLKRRYDRWADNDSRCFFCHSSTIRVTQSFEEYAKKLGIPDKHLSQWQSQAQDAALDVCPRCAPRIWESKCLVCEKDIQQLSPNFIFCLECLDQIDEEATDAVYKTFRAEALKGGIIKERTREIKAMACCLCGNPTMPEVDLIYCPTHHEMSKLAKRYRNHLIKKELCPNCEKPAGTQVERNGETVEPACQHCSQVTDILNKIHYRISAVLEERFHSFCRGTSALPKSQEKLEWATESWDMNCKQCSQIVQEELKLAETLSAGEETPQTFSLYFYCVRCHKPMYEKRYKKSSRPVYFPIPDLIPLDTLTLDGYKIRVNLGMICAWCYQEQAALGANLEEYRSSGEAIILEHARRLFGDRVVVVANARPYWLDKLELDVYIPELKLALEYDGEQHFKYIPAWHCSPEGFIHQQERDRRKEALCEKRGVHLIRYQYDEELSWELFIQKLQPVIPTGILSEKPARKLNTSLFQRNSDKIS